MPKRKIAERRQKHALGEDKISYLPLGEGVSLGEGFFLLPHPFPKYFEWGRSLHASLFRCHAAPSEAVWLRARARDPNSPQPAPCSRLMMPVHVCFMIMCRVVVFGCRYASG